MTRLLGLLLFGLGGSASAAPPNVVVIVGDDMGYADVGFHGCTDIPTPHLDALAKSGVRFTSGYVSGPYCSPTRAGLLTGRYQQRFGHEFNPGGNAKGEAAKIGLSLQERTLAELYRDHSLSGYTCGWVGKWHLGASPELHPAKRGFGSTFGFLGGAHPYIVKPNQAPIYRGTEEVAEKEYLTEAFGREAVAFVDKNKDKQFFLYLAFNAVHTPMDAVEKYLKRFPAIKDPKRQKYAAMMAAMDDAIGGVLGKLAEHKLEEETLIFFISDNGGPEQANASDNGPLNGGKATTWEGGVRVPFLVQWKSKFHAGLVYDKPVIQLDIVPTALAATGVQVPGATFDGVNLIPYLNAAGHGKTIPGKEEPHPAGLFWRFGDQTAVRVGDWKLVAARDSNGKKLFNLHDDIGETKDRSAEQPEKVKELQAAWDKWNKDNVPAKWGPPRQLKKQ